jgi:2-hydroxy-3-keto-5-methylthiopentenyl-1-phosphate phosphatase
MQGFTETVSGEICESEKWRKHDVYPELDCTHQKHPAQCDGHDPEKYGHNKAHTSRSYDTHEILYTGA